MRINGTCPRAIKLSATLESGIYKGDEIRAAANRRPGGSESLPDAPMRPLSRKAFVEGRLSLFPAASMRAYYFSG